MGDFSSLKRATLALDLQTARPKMELLSCSVQMCPSHLGTAEKGDEFRLTGETYVQGVMHREVMQTVERRRWLSSRSDSDEQFTFAS